LWGALTVSRSHVPLRPLQSQSPAWSPNDEAAGRWPMACILKTAHERAQIEETQLKQKNEQKRKSKWKTMPAKSNYISILL
jgi:hypothetical protein